jgi:hypothetical protein
MMKILGLSVTMAVAMIGLVVLIVFEKQTKAAEKRDGESHLTLGRAPLIDETVRQ